MDKILITGGERLRGEATVSGAKNAALPIIASSLLAQGVHRYRNVPNLADVSTLCKLLEQMGARATRGHGEHSDEVAIEVPTAVTPVASYELVKTMRASIVVLGPLVARYGQARISLPGGCAIGARPIDQHLKGLERMGAEILLEHGYVEARAKQLRGAHVEFDVVTVTGTENLMMAATLARGETVLENAAREPEVVDLARVLTKMGAHVEGAGTDTIRIQGVETLRSVEHEILPDRIEAGTLLVAATITGGELLLKRADPGDLEAILQKLRVAGATIEVLPEGIRCVGPERIQPLRITTAPYPGFPTDMQAQLMALLTVADGTSMITESVFENRFMHVQELNRMGADIRIDGRIAVVKGVKALSGAPVMATDLRASASLVLAGLRAGGSTEVQRVYHLDRGYDHLERKLAALGATIERVRAT